MMIQIYDIKWSNYSGRYLPFAADPILTEDTYSLDQMSNIIPLISAIWSPFVLFLLNCIIFHSFLFVFWFITLMK